MTMQIQLTGHQRLTEQLSILQKVEVPWILMNALNKGLAPELRARESKRIEQTFDRKSSRTINSPITPKGFGYATKDNLRILFQHSEGKGQSDGNPEVGSPTLYLAPQVYGGEVYLTRFNTRMRARGAGPYGIGPNEYIHYWANQTHKASYISAISDGLREGGAYKILRPRKDGKDSNDKRDYGFRGAGVYRIKDKGAQVEKVFTLLTQGAPRVNPKYDWSQAAMQKMGEEIFPESVGREIDKMFN